MRVITISAARLFLLLLLAAGSTLAAPAPGQPPAPVKNVDDTYWGVKVSDPYRYMEDLKSPQVQGWMKGQAAYTDSVLSRIPIRDEILARLKELDAGRPYRVGSIRRMPSGRIFYLKVKAEENLQKLYTRDNATAAEKLLVDPSTMTPPAGGHYSI